MECSQFIYWLGDGIDSKGEQEAHHAGKVSH